MKDFLVLGIFLKRVENDPEMEFQNATCCHSQKKPKNISSF
jgi:hypothetical protein